MAARRLFGVIPMARLSGHKQNSLNIEEIRQQLAENKDPNEILKDIVNHALNENGKRSRKARLQRVLGYIP